LVESEYDYNAESGPVSVPKNPEKFGLPGRAQIV